MIELCGWLGNLCFALCALPQVVMVVRNGHARGLSLPFLGMWFAGLVLATIYIAPKCLWPNLLNYAFGVVQVAIMLRYKLWPRVPNG